MENNAGKNKASFRRKINPAWSIAILIVILDQISKLIIQYSLPLWGKIPVISDFFNIVYILNRGAAFGFLNHTAVSWQTFFLIGITILAILVILHLLRTTEKQDLFFLMGLGAILGGAVGNLIDRIRLGMVIDFLDFYVGSFHWPAFNVADAAITLGAVSLLISFYRRERHASHTY